MIKATLEREKNKPMQITYFSNNKTQFPYTKVIQPYQIKTVPTRPNEGFFLYFEQQKLSLALGDKQLTLSVDFSSLAIQQRIKVNAAKLDLYKAIEGKNTSPLHILDMTAGLGQDSFTLAARDHHITAIEQNPYVFALLYDAIHRKNNDSILQICRRICLHFANSQDYNLSHQSFDIVYLDPMFPTRSKSAKVKKNMQLLHQLIGYRPQNDDALFEKAQQLHCKKIIVKRPKTGKTLGKKKPSSQIIGKSNRFDIYAQ